MKSLNVVHFFHWSRKFVYRIIFIKLYLTSDVCLGLFLYLKMQAEILILHCYENCLGEVYENYIAPCYAMIIIFVISSSKRICVTSVTSKNHK